MTLMEQKLYDMAAQAYEKYGYELVKNDLTGQQTCKVTECEEDFLISINTDIPETDEIVEIMDDFEDELHEEEFDVVESRSYYNRYIIKIKK